MLDALGVKYRLLSEPRPEGRESNVRNLPIAALMDEILIIGKNALSLDGDGIDLSQVPDGQRIIVFEQSAEVLEKRLGFRTAQYGLRQVFRRIADHPLLTNITDDNLRDWRGSATLLPEKLDYKIDDNVFNGAPTVEWCGITVPRVWRCGNRGSVASVLIEKPTCGDFLPILDGGFSLQYSPLMEYRHGKGMILFCQMDVTGRNLAGTPLLAGTPVSDPAATHLVGNMLRYVNGWKGEPKRKVVYAGNIRGDGKINRIEYLQKIGAVFADGSLEASEWLYPPDFSFQEHVQIYGTKGVHVEETETPNGKSLQRALHKSLSQWGGTLLLGQSQEALQYAFPDITVKNAEHISTYFEPFKMDSPLRGIGPADVHNRDPKNYPLITNNVPSPPGGGLGWGQSEDADSPPPSPLPKGGGMAVAPLPKGGGTIPVGDGILGVTDDGRTVICAMAPWDFPSDKQSFKRTFRRSAFVLSRILGNMNVDLRTPLVERFNGAVGKDEKRWLDGLYLDKPEEWDDPYRFFRW
jgi:hypothetical protein